MAKLNKTAKTVLIVTLTVVASFSIGAVFSVYSSITSGSRDAQDSLEDYHEATRKLEQIRQEQKQ